LLAVYAIFKPIRMSGQANFYVVISFSEYCVKSNGWNTTWTSILFFNFVSLTFKKKK